MSPQSIEMIMKLIYGLIVFACLIFLAYVVTRYIAQKASSTMQSKHMKVIEWVSLGMDKSIYLIKVGKENIIVSVSGKNIQYLKQVELEDEDIDDNYETKKQTEASGLFSKHLNKFMKDLISKESNDNENIENHNDNNVENIVASNVEKIKASLKVLKVKGKSEDENINE